MSTYSEKFRDPRWQKKRLEILNKYEFICLVCQTEDSQLHVHHGYYEKGRDPWDYPDSAFVVLCDECHNEWHYEKHALDIAIGEMSPEFIVWELLHKQLEMLDPARKPSERIGGLIEILINFFILPRNSTIKQFEKELYKFARICGDTVSKLMDEENV